jgi:hypothetical protein
MSVTEILSELPNLQANELEAVVSRALELQQDLKPGSVFIASPELIRAIEEADAEPEDRDIDISEAESIVKSWNTK